MSSARDRRTGRQSDSKLLWPFLAGPRALGGIGQGGLFACDSCMCVYVRVSTGQGTGTHECRGRSDPSSSLQDSGSDGGVGCGARVGHWRMMCGCVVCVGVVSACVWLWMSCRKGWVWETGSNLCAEWGPGCAGCVCERGRVGTHKAQARAAERLQRSVILQNTWESQGRPGQTRQPRPAWNR